MSFYTHNADKKSGDGLALTDWNNLSSAVAGKQGLTLALSGNDKVGIGTKLPTQKLEVAGHVKITGNVKITGTDLMLGFQGRRNGETGGHRRALVHGSGDKLLINFGGDYTGGVGIEGNVGIGITSPGEKLEINGKVKATHFIGDGSQITNLSVGLNGLNLAITPGNVGIGTASPAEKLEVVGHVKITGTDLMLDSHERRNGETGGHRRALVHGSGDKLLINFGGDYPGGVGIGGSDNTLTITTNNKQVTFHLLQSHYGANKYISWDGDGNWDSPSDRNTKTDIQSEQDILKRLVQLDVKNFRWKDSPESTKKTIGLIAQDVQPLFPSLVGEMPASDGEKKQLTLKLGAFGVLAVGAIKELKAEIDALKAKIEPLSS